MKLPRTIKAGPLTYTVEEDDAYLDAVSLKEEKTYGICEPDRERITLRTSVSDGTKRLTLFHEALHIAFHEVLADDEHEERIVEALDSPLLDLFDRNPALRRALWGDKNLTRCAPPLRAHHGGFGPRGQRQEDQMNILLILLLAVLIICFFPLTVGALKTAVLIAAVFVAVALLIRLIDRGPYV